MFVEFTSVVHWHGALMKEERTRPDVTTYSAVISAFEKNGQVEEALRIFAELRQWQKPNVISYSASIGACGAGGERR